MYLCLASSSNFWSRSQWTRGLRRRFAAARLLRMCVRIPPGTWIFVCCDFCVCCQVEVSSTSWSLVQRSLTECGASLCAIYKPREWGGPGPMGAVAPKTNKQTKKKRTFGALGGISWRAVWTINRFKLPHFAIRTFASLPIANNTKSAQWQPIRVTFSFVLTLGGGWDSWVGIATRYGLDGSGFRTPEGDEIFPIHPHLPRGTHSRT